MARVTFWCQALSRHMPTNCGPQKLLLAMASQRLDEDACCTPRAQRFLTQSHFSSGQSFVPPFTLVRVTVPPEATVLTRRKWNVSLSSFHQELRFFRYIQDILSRFVVYTPF